MAYTKTTWNNLSNPPINADNLNKIEQGIYDNSLGIDKINPSGTATTTAEIEEGQINDVIGFKSLKLKGQTSQYTTTGSQLFDLSNTNVDTQYNYNNGFKLTKSTNRTREITLRTPIPSGNYYISADVINSTLSNNNQMYVTFKGANNTNVLENVRFLNNGAVTINAEVVSLYFFVANSEADTATITLDNIMLNSGSTRKNFEKYTGGKASPNPDFPQDVNNVSGDNVIGISNKNILNQTDLTLGTISQSDGKTISSSASVLYTPNFIKIISSQAYTLSYNGTQNVTFRLFYYDEKKNFISTVVASGTQTPRATFTTLSNSKYLRIQFANTFNNNLQLEKGSTASTYTAHQGNNFDIDLPVENKLPYPYVQTTRTAEGITYTDLGDGRIKINGTATANSAFALYGTASSQITLNANYVYGGVNSNVRVRVMNRSSGGTYTTLGNSTGTSTKIDRSTVSTGYVEISIASGTTVNNLIITPMLSDNEVNAFTPYNVNPIELCKIGTYQDYIYKKDGKWWKHKEVEKITLNGSETPTINTALTNTTRALYSNILPYKSKGGAGSCICNLLPYYENWVTDVEGFYLDNNTTNLVFRINKSTVGTTITSLNNFLSENNMTVYYILETAIEEEITYAPLLRQLDEVYNSGLYDVTNISQDNSSEAFILDMEACKNNINGIVEYIRR